MKRSLLLSPLALLALSCSSNAPAQHPDFSLFPATDEPDLTYFSRNGDIFNQDILSYEEAFRGNDIEAISSRLDHGEGVFLYLYSDNCPNCKKARANVVSFISETGLEAFGVDFTNQSEGLSFVRSLIARYPSYDNIFETNDGQRYILTPSAFILRQEKPALALPFLSFSSDLKELEDYFLGLMNLTNVITFRSASALISYFASDEVLVYAGENDFYYSNIYPKAIRQSKYVVRYESLDPYPNIDGDIFLLKEGKPTNVIDSEKAPEEALKLIQGYLS